MRQNIRAVIMFIAALCGTMILAEKSDSTVMHVYVQSEEIEAIKADSELYAYFGPHVCNLVQELPMIEKYITENHRVADALSLLCDLIRRGYTTAPLSLIENALQEAGAFLESCQNTVSEADVACLMSAMQNYYASLQSISRAIIIATTGGCSGIDTINGDTGSATGSTITFAASGAGDTAQFAATGSVVTFNATDVSNNTAFGTGATTAGATNACAFGAGASAAGSANGCALGYLSNAESLFSIAIGTLASAPDMAGVALGSLSSAANNGVAVGTNTISSGNASVCVGGGAASAADYSVVMGTSAQSGTGAGSVAIGFLAGCMDAQTSNISIGQTALSALWGGSGSNVAIGASSLAGAAEAGFCVGLGDTTLSALTTGQYNTALGHNAGASYTSSESHNITINNQGTVGESNALHIGAGTGTGSMELNKAFIGGITGIAVAGVPVLVSATNQLGIAPSSVRFKKNVQDMADASSSVFALRPVTFVYDKESASGLSGACDERRFGLIAEEVAQAMPELVTLDEEGKPLTVKYHDMPAILLNEMKKLSARIEVLEDVIKNLTMEA